MLANKIRQKIEATRTCRSDRKNNVSRKRIISKRPAPKVCPRLYINLRSAFYRQTGPGGLPFALFAKRGGLLIRCSFHSLNPAEAFCACNRETIGGVMTHLENCPHCG